MEKTINTLVTATKGRKKTYLVRKVDNVIYFKNGVRVGPKEIEKHTLKEIATKVGRPYKAVWNILNNIGMLDKVKPAPKGRKKVVAVIAQYIVLNKK